MSENKKLLCKYSVGRTDDSGIEAVKLYMPVKGGYVNYNIVHSVMERTNCNTWRLSVVNFCDEGLEVVRPLTRSGAEWEMALKIKERPDFIGGYAHGDEVFSKIAVTVDGVAKELDELSKVTTAKELIFEVWSTGFDPSDSVTEALLHYKKIICNADGVRIEQRVEWLRDYELNNSFMAMLPPFKSETDHYFTDKDPEIKPIPPEGVNEQGNVKALYLRGKAGFTFGLKAEKYLTDEESGNCYFIRDNGGVPYNKMYFLLMHKGSVSKGDIWETVTEYQVTANE
jgi:hypothetical protein